MILQKTLKYFKYNIRSTRQIDVTVSTGGVSNSKSIIRILKKIIYFTIFKY